MLCETRSRYLDMPGGLRYKPSHRDFITEKAFGSASYAPKPLGRLEKVLASPLARHPLYQDHFPSCVVCAATFINQYGSVFNSDHDAYLSWVFPYASVTHYPTGTVPQEVLDFLRKNGQPENEKLPQEKVWGANDFFVANPNLAAGKGEGAERYRLGTYSFFEKPTIESVYPMLCETPLLIGINVDPQTWREDGIIMPGRKTYQHAVVLLDVDEEWNMKVVSWDKKDRLDIRTLHRDYPLIMAAVLHDIPDGTDVRTIRRGYMGFLRSLCRR